MVRLQRFTPCYCLPSVLAIPLSDLRELGVKAMLFDLDNTLTEHDNPEFDEKIIAWLRGLADWGIRGCLLSNNQGERVSAASRKLGLPFVAKARKPRREGFERACRLLQVTPRQTVVVGDQIFTDIWGGNRAGAITILVNPISDHDLWTTRHFSRRAERLIWPWVAKNLPADADCRSSRHKCR